MVLETEGATRPTLHAWGRSWPVRRISAQRWRGWVGVDLTVRPGHYVAEWRFSHRRVREAIVVRPRAFAVSRIRVPKAMAEFDAPTLARIRREAEAIRRCYRDWRGRAPAFRFLALPTEGIVSTPFGARRVVNGSPRAPHKGVDIAAPRGTPVRAPMDGRVALVLDGYLVGRTVCVAHGEGLVSVFMHLDEVKARKGAFVRAGEIIGTVGQTGRATGPHLHWGVVFRGAALDPLRLVANRATNAAKGADHGRKGQAGDGD